MQQDHRGDDTPERTPHAHRVQSLRRGVSKVRVEATTERRGTQVRHRTARGDQRHTRVRGPGERHVYNLHDHGERTGRAAVQVSLFLLSYGHLD